MGWNIGSEKFKSFNIQEMNWEQAREGVKQVSPHLFNVIESLDPNNTLTIIKARYPYGEKFTMRVNYICLTFLEKPFPRIQQNLMIILKRSYYTPKFPCLCH